MIQFLVSGLFSTAESYGKSDAVIEIIFMLLVAFLLGYLLRYFIDKNKVRDDWKEKYDEERHQKELLEQKLKMFETENRKLQDELSLCLQNNKHKSAVQGIASAPAKPVRKDNLKKIEGIGPKIEQMLYNAGIYTWEDLAAAEVQFLQSVLDQGGPAYKVHNPGSWPFQAKLAAEGKWEELKKWQDEHKRGLF